MKKALKISLIVALFLLLGFICFVMFKSNTQKQSLKTCAGVKVEYADSYRFVTPEDIERYLGKDYGAYIGQRLDSVDLRKVETILNSKSAVLKTEAFTTPDGFLNVKVYQREPIVRFQKGDNGFYADERGFLFPLQHNYTSRVPIIDGNIPMDVASGFKGEPKTDAEKEWLAQVIDLVNFLKGSKQWSENISQITVNGNGDLVMVPRQGKEKFIFGKPVNIESKFERIGKYYSAIVPEKGEGYYSSVSVKCDGQIICRK